MQTTTQTMRQHRKENVMGASLEQLSSMYRQVPSDYIIAEAFCKLSKLIHNNGNRYPHIESCDQASFALEKLQMCLLTYVPGSTNKFSTYFGRVFNNKLREESQRLNYHKRCIMFNCNSLQQLMEGDSNFDVEGDSDIKINLLCLPKNLTERELQYCKLLASGYGTNKEIAEKMNVSVMTLCNLRTNLRNKLKQIL